MFFITVVLVVSAVLVSCNKKDIFNDLNNSQPNSDYLHSELCSSEGFTSIEIPDSLLSPENYEGTYECEIISIVITNPTSNRSERYDVLLEVDENGLLSYIGFEDDMMSKEGFASNVLVEHGDEGDRQTLNECLRGCVKDGYPGCRWACFGDYLVDILDAVMPL